RRRLAQAAVELLVDGAAVDQNVQGAADCRVGQERVSGLDRRPLPVDLLPRIGVVELDVLDATAGCDVDVALAALLGSLEDLIRDLEVPGEVVLPRLEHRARRGRGLAAALHLELVEEGTIRDVIGGINLAPTEVAGPEIHEAVGSRPDRLQVGRRLPRPVALEGLEQMLRNDHAARPAEGVEPEWGRVLERELDRVIVELLDPLDVTVGGDRHRRGRRVGCILPVEDEIVGRERLSVVPADTALELPGDRFPVPRHAAVLERRNLLGEDRKEIGLRVERGERLVEHPRAVLVLGADGEVRVQERRGLPPEYLELPAAAATRRGEPVRPRLCRNRGGAQHLGGKRRGEAEPDHDPGEIAARQARGPNVRDETVDISFVHEVVLQPVAVGRPTVLTDGPRDPASASTDGPGDTAVLTASVAHASGVDDAVRELDLIRPPRPKQASDFTVSLLGGETLKLRGQRGKPVLVNFWATWCAPCREEMPAMERLYLKHRERGFVLLAVSVDTDASLVKPFLERL